MILYHKRNNSMKMSSNSKNNTKTMKKKYKSVINRKGRVIPTKSTKKVGRKTKAKKLKKPKNISKKNINFLEGLGLKVKDSK